MKQPIRILALSAILCSLLVCSVSSQSGFIQPKEGAAVQIDAALNCSIPVWLIEPDTRVRIRFLNLNDYLTPAEELVTESVNAQVFHADRETLEFRPSYTSGVNNGYVLLIARQGIEERLLGAIRFASEEMPYDGAEDIRIDPLRAVAFPEIYDFEQNRTLGYLGFFTDGSLRDWVSLIVAYEQSLAPDRPRRLPKWVEAELKIPIGGVGSSIPRIAVPVRPRDCQGFQNGRKTVEGPWVNIGEPKPTGSAVVCGSINNSGNNTYTRTLCGKAAAEFAINLGGIKLPGFGQIIDVGGNIKIKGEANGCITVTITNTTGATVNIICRTSRVNQLKFRDVFCCRDGVPYLCERWVCYRYVDVTTAEIPAFGIVLPGSTAPSPETCTRTN